MKGNLPPFSPSSVTGPAKTLNGIPRPAVGEHAFQKILQSLRIVQPAFFLYRHLGEMFHEGAGKQADPVVRLHPLSVEERNPLVAPTRRGALVDKAGEG